MKKSISPKDLKQKLRGIMPAVVSPHDIRDRFAGPEFERQAEFLYERGVHGLYVCGATGEGYSMRLEERKAALEIAVECSRGRGAVIVHIGAQSTRDAAELAHHAAKTGADGVASIPPLGRSLGELVAYYGDIARASGLPTFVYHFPALIGRQSTLSDLLELLDVRGVAGIKFSDSDLFLMARILQERPMTIVFNGFDELLMPALLYGARGGIGTWYNLVPQIFVSIWRSVEAGDLGGALDLQKRFLRLALVARRVGTLETFDMLVRRQGIVRHVFRRPFVPFDRRKQANVRHLLAPICRELEIDL